MYWLLNYGTDYGFFLFLGGHLADEGVVGVQSPSGFGPKPFATQLKRIKTSWNKSLVTLGLNITPLLKMTLQFSRTPDHRLRCINQPYQSPLITSGSRTFDFRTNSITTKFRWNMSRDPKKDLQLKSFRRLLVGVAMEPRKNIIQFHREDCLSHYLNWFFKFWQKG